MADTFGLLVAATLLATLFVPVTMLLLIALGTSHNNPAAGAAA